MEVDENALNNTGLDPKLIDTDGKLYVNFEAWTRLIAMSAVQDQDFVREEKTNVISTVEFWVFPVIVCYMMIIFSK